MVDPIDEFFLPSSQETPHGHFHRTISLETTPDLPWDEVRKLSPSLPKGWYELTPLHPKARIGFIHDYWISTLPYHPRLHPFLDRFFEEVSSLRVYLTQKVPGAPFEAQIVYEQKSNNCFYRGFAPADESQLIKFHEYADEFIYPDDYAAFFKIHNGFCKGADTGIIPLEQFNDFYEKFQKQLKNIPEPILAPDDTEVNPASLIPFYESFDFPCFQCFYKDWYPSLEMGNIYYSGLTNTITAHTKSKPHPEEQSFPSFSDWLIFYLESIE